MHPEEIKAAIRMAGSTPTTIARQLELSRSTVSKVIHGEGVSARVRAAVATVIGRPVSAIWPACKPAPQRADHG